MPTIKVGGLTFAFPRGWEIAKLDEWAYYRKQFLNIGNNVRMACGQCSAELTCAACKTSKMAGIKGCDIVAIWSPVLWLIEVKDYRRNQRTKAIGLADEVTLKIRDSLSVLLGAKANANDPAERALATKAVATGSIRVILHLEQTTKPSKLFPRAINPADVLQRMRQQLKAIDPHPLVSEIADMRHLPWTVI